MSGLFHAWRALGMNAGFRLDPTPRGGDGGATFCCPRCVEHVALDIHESDVSCPECSWAATGEPWQIAQAGKMEFEKRTVKAPKEGKDFAAMLQSRRFCEGSPPPEDRLVFAINGTPICHAGNITTLEAHIKGGKSAFTAAAIASTWAKKEADCLGWQSSNPDGRAVLHFDTEQSLGDHYRLMMRALARGENGGQPGWLESYCITGFSCEDMQGAIADRIEHAGRVFGGVHSLFLDGAADPVNDINDPKESFAFVSWLHKLAIAGGFPIINVIHLNPGDTGKSRGHLGSQLNRKSEHILKLTRKDDVSTVHSGASRRSPMPLESCPVFAWSEEHGRHLTQGGVVAERPMAAKSAGGRPKAFDCAEILELIGGGWVGYMEASALCKAEGWKPTQFKQAWGSLKMSGRLVQSVAEPGKWGAKK